jgi:hypothetical protein
MEFHHEHFDIEKLLTSGSDDFLKYLFSRPAEEVRTELNDKLIQGVKITTNCFCDNFDSDRGCLGHTYKEW